MLEAVARSSRVKTDSIARLPIIEGVVHDAAALESGLIEWIGYSEHINHDHRRSKQVMDGCWKPLLDRLSSRQIRLLITPYSKGQYLALLLLAADRLSGSATLRISLMIIDYRNEHWMDAGIYGSIDSREDRFNCASPLNRRDSTWRCCSWPRTD